MSNIATTFIKNNSNREPLFFDVLRQRAEKNGEEKAFTFLSNGDALTLTYSDLDIKIRRLAAYLQQKNLKGERALLLYPPGFEYIIGYFACLYAGIIAVPVYPPDSSSMEKTLPRIDIIARDSGAKIALSTESVIDEVKSWQKNIFTNEVENEGSNSNNEILSGLKELFEIEWLATDTYSDKVEDSWIYPDIRMNDIAYLQYTSGSTGDPKGVMITHQNLIHNTKLIYHGFELNNSENEGVIWLPIYHDMGLVGGILEPIFAGFHCTLLSPIDFLKRPIKWLNIISEKKEKSIVSGGPNFAYDLCLKATSKSKREELDLSNWRLAFTGAEPVRPDTIIEFSKAFRVSGFNGKAFFPCYGLAEGTLIVSGSSVKTDPKIINFDKEELKINKGTVIADDQLGTKLVSAGKSILDVRIKIVDPDTMAECSDSEVGEIWVSSNSNAKGYWRKKDLSGQIFQAVTSGSNDGPFLRTGDLGFLFKEDLFITGRLKDLIIIRGNNHYPQDIEKTAERSNKLLRPGRIAAFSVDIKNEEQLVIVLEARAKQNVDWSEVCLDIKASVLSEHNILPYKIVLIKSKTIFLTSSGKIQRKSTKDSYLKNNLEIVYEWTAGEDEENETDFTNTMNVIEDNKELKLDTKTLADIITENLAEELKLNPKRIDKNIPFTDFGLDSAKSVMLVGKLENIVDKPLEQTILWNYPSINKLAAYLSGEVGIRKNENAENENESKDEFAKKVSDLSEEEATELLLKKLNNSDEI